MGIVERRERLKKQVRSDIIATARDIAREEGWQSVSIRKIADIIEYSPPILYEYFESKDKLLECIRISGFDTLKVEFERIKKLYRNPEKRMPPSKSVYDLLLNLAGSRVWSWLGLVCRMFCST